MGPPEGVLAITSPSQGDTLGLQFSVFGTCDAIKPDHNPTITATLKDDNDHPVQSVTTINNQDQGTWEAVFSLPFDPGITNGKVKITCPGMHHAEVGGLIVTNQDAVLTISLPFAAEQFSLGDVTGRVTLSTGYSLRHYVTQAGYQLEPPPPPPPSVGSTPDALEPVMNSRREWRGVGAGG